MALKHEMTLQLSVEKRMRPTAAESTTGHQLIQVQFYHWWMKNNIILRGFIFRSRYSRVCLIYYFPEISCLKAGQGQYVEEESHKQQVARVEGEGCAGFVHKSPSKGEPQAQTRCR